MKNNKMIRLCGVLGGSVLLLVAFFMFFAPFLSTSSSLGGGAVNTPGYDLTFGDGAVAGITTTWVFSFLLALVSLCAICLFVLDELLGKFHLAFLDKKMARLGLGCCVGVFGLVTAILFFCVVPMIGVSNGYSLSFGLGAGAVMGGIFTLLGGCALACGICLPTLKK